MKTSINFSRLFCILLTTNFLLITSGLFSQVTIGSGNKPNTGALLDLKIADSSTVNATKGLGMPRVGLKRISPTTPSDFAASIGNSGTWDLNEHIGLFVYNNEVTSDLDTGKEIPVGLYVWDGTKWKNLNTNSGGGNTNPCDECYDDVEVGTIVDARDGEEYYYGHFHNAGYWMLQNLRFIPTSLGVSHNANPSFADKAYAYPDGGENPYNTQNHPKASWTSGDLHVMGIIYSFAAATTEGLCPSGWHVPTSSEWNALEKELYNCANRYSTFDINRDFYNWRWQDSWSTTSEYRGSSQTQGHGQVMLSSKVSSTYGKSLPADKGGFDALSAGYGISGTVYDNSLNVYFWTSTSINSVYADTRMMKTDFSPYYIKVRSATGNMNDSKRNLYSVRCMRNDKP